MEHPRLKDAARKGHSEAEQQKFPVIDTVDANYLRGSGEKDVWKKSLWSAVCAFFEWCIECFFKRKNPCESFWSFNTSWVCKQKETHTHTHPGGRDRTSHFCSHGNTHSCITSSCHLSWFLACAVQSAMVTSGNNLKPRWWVRSRSLDMFASSIALDLVPRAIYEKIPGQRGVYSANNACGTSRSRAYHQTENQYLGLPDLVGFCFLVGTVGTARSLFLKHWVVHGFNDVSYFISKHPGRASPDVWMGRNSEAITKASGLRVQH